MSAEAVGSNLPGVIALDLPPTQAAYLPETSTEGAFSVLPPPGGDHQIVCRRRRDVGGLWSLLRH